MMAIGTTDPKVLGRDANVVVGQVTAKGQVKVLSYHESPVRIADGFLVVIGAVDLESTPCSPKGITAELDGAPAAKAELVEDALATRGAESFTKCNRVETTSFVVVGVFGEDVFIGIVVVVVWSPVVHGFSPRLLWVLQFVAAPRLRPA